MTWDAPRFVEIRSQTSKGRCRHRVRSLVRGLRTRSEVLITNGTLLIAEKYDPDVN